MKKGFTLVEIMIVVAIIALLAAIAIPNLLRARISAQESAAAAALHTVAAAEIQWRATNPTYATLVQLGAAVPPYIDATLAGGAKQGYTFTVTPNNTGPGGSGVNFFGEAVNTAGQAHSFYVDEAGVLCRSTAAVGVAALGAHQGGTCPATHPEMQ